MSDFIAQISIQEQKVKDLHAKLKIVSNDLEIRLESYKFTEWVNWDETLDFLNSQKGIKGVYVVYGDLGCLYVGSTGGKRGIWHRLRYHEKYVNFMRDARYVACYPVEDIKERLLLERIKILQLNPALNADSKGNAVHVMAGYNEQFEDDMWDLIDDVAKTNEEIMTLINSGSITYEQIATRIIEYGGSNAIREILFEILRGS